MLGPSLLLPFAPGEGEIAIVCVVCEQWEEIKTLPCTDSGFTEESSFFVPAEPRGHRKERLLIKGSITSNLRLCLTNRFVFFFFFSFNFNFKILAISSVLSQAGQYGHIPLLSGVK